MEIKLLEAMQYSAVHSYYKNLPCRVTLPLNLTLTLAA